jgi:hypothetical protein
MSFNTELNAALISATGFGHTAGGQLAFPATQNASAGANTLDDYEEGTWTAAFTAGTGSITINTSYNTGAYTKIGRQVTITGYFAVTSVSSPTGALTITGLPFTSGAGTEGSHTIAVSFAGNGMETTAATAMIALINNSGAVIFVKHFAAGATPNTAAAHIKAGSDMMINATYFI